MKLKRKIGDLGKDKIRELVESFLEELGEGAAALLEYFEETESPEFETIEVDNEGKLLSFTRKDGSHYAYNLRSETIDALMERVSALENETVVDNFDNIEDVEERPQMTLDSNDKIVSFRKSDGTLVEPAGIETPTIKSKNVNADNLNLSEEGLKSFEETLKADGIGTDIQKDYYLPKFGRVDLKTETFYLDAANGGWSSYTNDVILIQVNDDTDENASKRLTLSYFYIKSTLTPNPDYTYDRNSITPSSIMLELHAGKDVAKIGNKYFATAVYRPVIDAQGYITDYNKIKATKVTDPNTGDVIGYELDGESTEVKKVVDVPPINAWKVNKNIEHYLTADIDFGTFLTMADAPVSIKYQGSYSTKMRKRGLRLTFYKNNKYEKKLGVKVGEMVKLKGFNLKSYAQDPTRVKDPVLSNLFIEIWNTRGDKAYPWNEDSIIYNGATGMIKSFPIETYIGTEFFGLQFFSEKKDGNNYMLDGDHDASGIFVSGDVFKPWQSATSRDWEDELDADDKVPAYEDLPSDRTSVSVETAEALDTLFAFIGGWLYKNPDDSLYIKKFLVFEDAESNFYEFSEVEVNEDEEIVVTSDPDTVIEHVYRKSTIGRIPTQDSIVVTLVPGTDTYEDGQGNIYQASQVTEISGTYYVTDSLGYEVLPTTLEVTRIPFDEDNVGDYINAASFIDYFICMQLCQGWDNNYHNMILHTRADKKLFYLFMYDLDNTLQAAYNYDVVADTSRGDESLLWIKFFGIFKDSIINRYAELRKNVLKDKNIEAIYKSYVEGIPEEVAEAERNKWGYSSFDSILTLIKNRLAWLDETYFNLINY